MKLSEKMERNKIRLIIKSGSTSVSVSGTLKMTLFFFNHMVFFPYLFFGHTAQPVGFPASWSQTEARPHLRKLEILTTKPPENAQNCFFKRPAHSSPTIRSVTIISCTHRVPPPHSCTHSAPVPPALDHQPTPVCMLGLMWKVTRGSVKHIKLTQVLLIRQYENNRFSLNSAVLCFFKRTQNRLLPSSWDGEQLQRIMKTGHWI